jgi:hypothetical protein
MSSGVIKLTAGSSSYAVIYGTNSVKLTKQIQEMQTEMYTLAGTLSRYIHTLLGATLGQHSAVVKFCQPQGIRLNTTSQ